MMSQHKENKSCYKCLERIINLFSCSCSSTQLSYCCLTCLLDDGKCHSKSCQIKVEDEVFEKTRGTSPWIAIKQRAGSRTPNLIDPTSYVFREGISVYQMSSSSDNQFSSPSNNSNNNNSSFLDIPESSNIMGKSSEVDQCSALRTSCKIESSEEMDISAQSDFSSDASMSSGNSSAIQCLGSGRFGDASRRVFSAVDDSSSEKVFDSNKESDNGSDFGKGWWKRPQKNKEQNSEPQQALKDDGHDFGSGWWKSRRESCVNSQNSEGRKKKRNTSGSSGSKRKRVKKSVSNNSEFGSGWWVGRLDGSSKTNDGQNSYSNLDSSRNDLSLSNNTSKTKSKKTTEQSKKAVLDIVPYRALDNPGLVHEFLLQATLLKKELLNEEEDHGRKISLTFATVPGLWKASLGGSRCSLLVKVIGRSSHHKHAVKVKDIHGHSTTVVFPFINNTDNLPGMGEESSFIFLRSVHWHEFKNGKLGIVMNERENVLIS